MKPIVGKTAFVDLTSKTVRVENTPRQLVNDLLGGRGANMAYLYHMLPSGTDALSPKNVLLFGTSVLTGYPRKYLGLNVPNTQSTLEQDLGKGVRSAVIGPAGENLVRFANIMNSRKNSAGRGGMGAVMGSKNLKAVVATGNVPLEIADRTNLLALRKTLPQYLHESKIIKLYGRVGTVPIFWVMNTFRK
jgi:aldehyde:ferredoxin oxidoreductase